MLKDEIIKLVLVGVSSNTKMRGLKSRSTNYSSRFQNPSMQGTMPRRSARRSARRRSVSQRSAIFTRDQYDELPSDMEELKKIYRAKEKHHISMKKILDQAVIDALENDMIHDKNQLVEILQRLEKQNKDLDREIVDCNANRGEIL